MMKKLLPLFFVFSAFAEDNPYKAINTRNAFMLAEDTPKRLPPASLILEQVPIKLNLTGIITYKGLTSVYLASKDIPKKFITLNDNHKTDEGITLLSISKSGLVKVDNNGTIETLSFDTHKLPNNLPMPSKKAKPTIIKEKKDGSIKISPAKAAQPNIVKVPSRRPKIDPRIIQKGLEYIDKIEDKEKKEYILNRLERLQSGQDSIKKDVKDNEIRRQYDERRKRDK